MSFGKNIRSFGPASRQTPLETLLSVPDCVLKLADVCATAAAVKIAAATMHTHCFIFPPQLDRAPHCIVSPELGLQSAKARASIPQSNRGTFGSKPSLFFQNSYPIPDFFHSPYV